MDCLFVHCSFSCAATFQFDGITGLLWDFFYCALGNICIDFLSVPVTIIRTKSNFGIEQVHLQIIPHHHPPLRDAEQELEGGLLAVPHNITFDQRTHFTA